VSPSNENLLGVAYADQNTAIAVGDYGTIIRTANGGSSWTSLSSQLPQPSTLWLTGVAFSTSANGVAVGRRAGPVDQSVIFRTTDGGVTWVQRSTPWNKALEAIAFGESKIGFAVGDGGIILRTTDDGATWTRSESSVTASRLNAVHAFGTNFATAVGDGTTILQTSDGGNSWVQQKVWLNNRLLGVWFLNVKIGLIVGEGGTMLRTSDGGDSWLLQTSTTTNSLYAVCFSDPDKGVVVGDHGTILRTVADDLITTSTTRDGGTIPIRYQLLQNYPNPFNPSTAISYQLSAVSFVTLKVYDILGREIEALVDEIQSSGTHTVRWNASRYSSGVYFYRLQCRSVRDQVQSSYIATRKMVVVK
jgi:photosystem II stability/assembly factor-like uncharacterized protein